MKTLRRMLWAPMALLVASAGWAEILVDQEAGKPPASEEGYSYQHPKLRSLVFSSPESRGQAILPPSPYFVPAPALIWRAPGAAVYPPIMLYSPGFHRPGSPSAAEMARYNLARAHAMRQGLYTKDGLWFGYSGTYPPGSYVAPQIWGWGWGVPLQVPLSPPAAAGQAHPSNRDNANYLIERAHRFSADVYRKP